GDSDKKEGDYEVVQGTPIFLLHHTSSLPCSHTDRINANVSPRAMVRPPPPTHNRQTLQRPLPPLPRHQNRLHPNLPPHRLHRQSHHDRERPLDRVRLGIPLVPQLPGRVSHTGPRCTPPRRWRGYAVALRPSAGRRYSRRSARSNEDIHLVAARCRAG